MPNTEFLKDGAELNQWGEIMAQPYMSTNILRVYAAGDSIAKRFRQVTPALADGTFTALTVLNFLHENRSKNFINIQLFYLCLLISKFIINERKF